MTDSYSQDLAGLAWAATVSYYPAWRILIAVRRLVGQDRLIAANKDSKQPIHLEAVLTFIELCIPLSHAK